MALPFPAGLLATLRLRGQARKRPPTTAHNRGGSIQGLALSAGKEGSQAHAASSAGCASKSRLASPSFVQHHCRSRGIFLPFPPLLLHFTESNAPSSEVTMSRKGMHDQHPVFSLQGQAGSIPALKRTHAHPGPNTRSCALTLLTEFFTFSLTVPSGAGALTDKQPDLQSSSACARLTFEEHQLVHLQGGGCIRTWHMETRKLGFHLQLSSPNQ